jgi:hypothetical protein
MNPPRPASIKGRVSLGSIDDLHHWLQIASDAQ